MILVSSSGLDRSAPVRIVVGRTFSSTGFGVAVGDGKGLGHAGYRHPVGKGAVAVKVGVRMTFDGRDPAAYDGVDGQ